MPPSIPTTYQPVFESSVLFGKEAPASPGVAPSAFTGIPMAPIQPDNLVTWLSDDNLRGSQIKTFNLQAGPRWAEHAYPESPAYGDTVGVPIYGLLGDYVATGTAGSPSWTASGAISAGPGPIAVTSASSAAAGTFIQIDTSTNSEVVKVGTGSTATSIVVDPATPIRFNHLTGVAIVTCVAPFTHTFSLLNSASSTGNTAAQPPTWTMLHKNGLGATYGIDQFLYGHFSEVKLEAKKDSWCYWSGKSTSYTQGVPSQSYSPSFTSVTGWPSWRSTVTLAGSPTYNVTDISITLTREMDVINTSDGVEDPYAIAAGLVTTAFSIDYDAVVSEAALNFMLQNTEPTLSWVTTNGLSGASTVSMTVNAQLAAHKKAPLAAMKTLWGYRTTGELMGNTTNAGNSGGYSPCQVILVNSIPTY